MYNIKERKSIKWEDSLIISFITAKVEENHRTLLKYFYPSHLSLWKPKYICVQRLILSSDALYTYITENVAWGCGYESSPSVFMAYFYLKTILKAQVRVRRLQCQEGIFSIFSQYSPSKDGVTVLYEFTYWLRDTQHMYGKLLICEGHFCWQSVCSCPLRWDFTWLVPWTLHSVRTWQPSVTTSGTYWSRWSLVSNRPIVVECVKALEIRSGKRCKYHI